MVVTNPANGCTASATAIVTQNITSPVASIAAPGHLNCVTSSLQLNGAASSQGANFAYQWTTTNGNITAGANTLTPTVNAAGLYTLLVTNTTNGCTATATATVTQSPFVTATLSAITNASCHGSSNGSATAIGGGGTGNYTYAWSNGVTTATASNLPEGTYIVTITDSENCTATASAAITQPAMLNANATATGETAAGASNGTATATPVGGTPGYTYVWNTSATTAMISGLAPGNYTVTVTDANNCTAVQTVTVNSFNCTLTATISATNVTCNGAANGTATANVSGAALPVSYLWSNGVTTATAMNLAPGTYTVQITDANNCPAELSVSITSPNVLLANASATNQTAVGVNNGTATALPSGGTVPYNYLWNTSNNTQMITSLAPGSYTVTVTDGNGCTAVQTVTVNAFNCNLSGTVSASNVSCAGGNDGTATAVPTGGTLPIDYLWSNSSTTATATGLIAGTYTVTLTDNAGCQSTASITITQPAPLTVQTQNVQPASCPESQDGSAVVVAQGGTVPYQLSWPSGSGGQNLGVGSYLVSVADANGCSATQTVTIVSNDITLPVITCPTAPVQACADVPVQFSSPPVSDNCSLNGAQAVQTAGLPGGSVFPVGETVQVFQITDVSGNSATCSFSVVVGPPIVITLAGTTPDVGNAGVGSIDVNVSGGSGSLSFSWEKDGQPFANTEDLTGLMAGSYILVVTDANGCSQSLPAVKIDNTVATSEPGDAAQLRIIPNPAGSSFRLEMHGVQPIDVQILDIHGRLIRKLEASEWTGLVDVTQIPAGMYYLRMLDLSSRAVMVKWIKSN